METKTNESEENNIQNNQNQQSNLNTDEEKQIEENISEESNNENSDDIFFYPYKDQTLQDIIIDPRNRGKIWPPYLNQTDEEFQEQRNTILSLNYLNSNTNSNNYNNNNSNNPRQTAQSLYSNSQILSKLNNKQKKPQINFNNKHEELFWFSAPNFVLRLIHFSMLFQFLLITIIVIKIDQKQSLTYVIFIVALLIIIMLSIILIFFYLIPMVLKRFVLSSSHQMLKNQEIINQVSFQQREQQISAFLKLFRYIKHLRRNHTKLRIEDNAIIKKKFINSQLENLFSKNKQFKQSDIQKLAYKLGAYLNDDELYYLAKLQENQESPNFTQKNQNQQLNNHFRKINSENYNNNILTQNSNNTSKNQLHNSKNQSQKPITYKGLQNSINILSSEVKLDPGEICSDLFFQIFGQKQLVTLEEFKFTIFSNIMPKLIEKNEQQIILDLVNLLPKNENNQFSLFQISCLIRDMVEGYPR